jgi:hypothetical protein
MQGDEVEDRKGTVERRALAQPGLGRLRDARLHGLQLLRDGIHGVPDAAQQRVEDQQQGHERQVDAEGAVLRIRDVL